jgi:hypothetical protein
LCNCLPPTVSSISDHNLRNDENYAPPRSKLRMSMASFIPSTVSLWNNLELNVRNSPNISCLKSKIKENTIRSPENYSEGSRKKVIQGRIQDFKVGGGGALKKIAPSGGRREKIWVFRVKNHDFTPKNLISSNCGGRREICLGVSCEKSRFYVKFFSPPILGCAPPPWIRP